MIPIPIVIGVGLLIGAALIMSGRKRAAPVAQPPAPRDELPPTPPPARPPIVAPPPVPPKPTAQRGIIEAVQLALNVATDLELNGRQYNKILLREFQAKAGLGVDGVYGGSSAGAVKYYIGLAGFPFEPAHEPLFPPALRTYKPAVQPTAETLAAIRQALGR